MNEPIRILLVEDNDTDADLVVRRFSRTRKIVAIERVKNGEEAMLRLRDHSKPKPDLIMLDIQMPKMNGREVLGELRVDQELDDIPVVVLSGSSLDDDRKNAYALGASSYLVKPGDPSEYHGLLDDFERYWIGRNSYRPR